MILGFEGYAMLTGDPSYGYTGGESVQHVLLAKTWRDLGPDVSIIVHDHGQRHVTMLDGIRAVAAFPRNSGFPVLRFVHPRLTQVMRAMREIDADVYYQSPAAPWTGVAAFVAARDIQDLRAAHRVRQRLPPRRAPVAETPRAVAA